MAYTSGVFYVHFTTGSDAARSALTSCTASNPSGTITRINKTAHGLATGAVVDLTLFSTWLNEAWKITVVDADNFDLDGAVWQTTADASGTVTPRGGTRQDPFLTITNGPTAARIQPGDTVRTNATPETSLGQNATWTNESQTVTLTSAVTKKINDAVSGWTAATNVTAGTNSSRKIGATSVTISPAGAFTTGKLAYAALDGGGTQDFSAYQYICLWWRQLGAVAESAADFKICLCSDATGDTIVNEINLPAILGTTTWQPMVLSYGGNLGASIQSVAIYANVDPGTTGFAINNIFASNGTISLKTLIGKAGDVVHNVQSIDGTTIKIDSANSSATGRGYSGATNTETLYYISPIESNATGNWQSIQEAGSSRLFNTLDGGYDLSTGTQTGITAFAGGGSGLGAPFTSSTALNYWHIKNIVLARFSSINIQPQMRWTNVVCSGSQNGFTVATSNVVFTNCKVLNTANSMSVDGGSGVVFNNCEFRSCTSVGFTTSGGVKLLGCLFANNSTADIAIDNGNDSGTGAIIAKNTVFGASTEVAPTSPKDQVMWSFNHDDTPGNHWAFFDNGTVNWQTSEKQGSDPGAWKVNILSSARGVERPFNLYVGPILVNASSLVTVSVWVKKDHATNIGAKLRVLGEAYTLAGVAEASDTKADDTSWEQLSVSFTPTEKGALELQVECYYVAAAGNVYVGSVTVTQA